MTKAATTGQICRPVAGRASTTCGACIRRLCAGLALLLLPTIEAPAKDALPRSVLLLDQSIPYTEYFSKFFGAFNTTLKERLDTPVTIYSEQLEYSHFKGPDYDALLNAFIRQKYREKPIGIIVAVGSNALQFALNLRTDPQFSRPIVFASVDERVAAQLRLPADVTGTTQQTRFGDAIVAAKVFVPDLKRIVVVGDPLREQTYRHHYEQDLRERAGDLQLVDLTGLAVRDVRTRVAALPQDTAIFYTTLSIDGAGVRYDPNDALALIAEVANRPIVVDQETRLGHGGAGGFLLHAVPIGEATARLVLRLFDGENASAIPVATGNFIKPVFDWRALQRWNVSEARLPPGSDIRFRKLTAWDQYRWQIILLAAAIVGQSLLITYVLIENHKRRKAELSLAESEERMTFTAASANVGLWQFNRETEELWATDHCRALFGLAADVPLTRETFLAAIRPEDRHNAVAWLRGVARTGRSGVTDLRVALPDGNVRWIRVRARSDSQDHGAANSLSGVFVDVTDQKAAETEAAEQRQEVTHLMRVS